MRRKGKATALSCRATGVYNPYMSSITCLTFLIAHDYQFLTLSILVISTFKLSCFVNYMCTCTVCMVAAFYRVLHVVLSAMRYFQFVASNCDAQNCLKHECFASLMSFFSLLLSSFNKFLCRSCYANLLGIHKKNQDLLCAFNFLCSLSMHTFDDPFLSPT